MPLESVPLRVRQLRGLLGNSRRVGPLRLDLRDSRFDLLERFLFLER